jgi:antitoxin (DNA-binding transcriptional repressor) of toxin-antitoxin stability system
MYFSCQLDKKKLSLCKELIMEKMSVGEFKTHFSRALKKVQAGGQVAITFGKNKEIVARLVPKANAKKHKRKIGILDGKAKITFATSFKMTEDEFLGT